MSNVKVFARQDDQLDQLACWTNTTDQVDPYFTHMDTKSMKQVYLYTSDGRM